VDTPVWSLALRRRASDLSSSQKDLVRELGELIREGRAALVGPVRQEVLSGVREEPAFEQLRKRLHDFRAEPTTVEDFERAAYMFNVCRRKGVTGTPTDLLLCALAERHEMAVFTTDSDFRRYARLLDIRLHATRKVEGQR
jgi:predicted nucleic acid-binding protein